MDDKGKEFETKRQRLVNKYITSRMRCVVFMLPEEAAYQKEKVRGQVIWIAVS